MDIRLAHFPTFTDKSIPLGLACINGALQTVGTRPRVYDYDFLLNVEDPELYYQVHHYAWQGDEHVVNFLGGADQELVLRTVFRDQQWIERQALDDPDRHRFLVRILAFIDRAVEQLLEGDPDEVWCSTYVSNFWLTMVAARRLRERAPGLRIGFGGPSIFTEEAREFVLLNRIADFCFVGEAEPVVMDYVRAGVPVPGMAHLHDGRVYFESRKLDRRLETLPPPDFTGFPLPGQDLRAYLQREFNGIPVFFSRGCVQRCAFCAERNIWQRFRVKSPEAIVEELQYYQRNYGISLFYNCDSLVNFTEKWLDELCDAMLEADLNCSFSFAFAIGKRLPAQLAQKMVRAGFTRIFIGAEHASQPMLDRMNKGTVAEEVIQVAADAVEAGLSVQLGTIVNFPGETTEDVLAEIRVFKEIDDALRERGVPDNLLPRRSLANRFRLDPGTPMLAAPEQHGIRVSRMPNPLDTELPGLDRVLLRWDYIEPQDVEFHFYLASQFGNLPDRWAVPAHLASRMASGLAGFLADDDKLAFAPWCLVSRPEAAERSLRLFDRVLPLSEKIYQLLRTVTSGITLAEAFSHLQQHFRVSRALFDKTVALFYLERALVFNHVAPLGREPEPRRARAGAAVPGRRAGAGAQAPASAGTPADPGTIPVRWHPGQDKAAAGAAMIVTSGGD